MFIMKPSYSHLEPLVIALGTDPIVMNALCEHLPQVGTITTPAGWLAQGQDRVPDLVILDDSVTGWQNFSVSDETTVIILKNINNSNILLGFDNALNLVKPVRVEALCLMVTQVLSQHKHKKPLLMAADCVLDKYHQTLGNPLHAKHVALTEKEIIILEYLYINKNQMVARTQLHKAIWGYEEEINTHTLETHIYRLRTRIREIETQKLAIETDGDGYRLKITL